jgi:hypothetical protein
MSASAARWDEPDASTVTGSTASSIGRKVSGGLKFEKFARHYDSGIEEKWQITVLNKLLEITRLRANWDGYGGPAVTSDTAWFAIGVLSQVMLPRTPVPQVVPSSVGGVQIEWHTGGIDLEFHIIAPYECELWFDDNRAGNAVSKILTNDLSELQSAVRVLTRR